METVKHLGYKTDKRIESEAFWAADRQRIEEEVSRKECQHRLQLLQKNIKGMWERRVIRRPKERTPGPLDYQTPYNNYVSTFKKKEHCYSFTRTPRYLNLPLAIQDRKFNIEQESIIKLENERDSKFTTRNLSQSCLMNRDKQPVLTRSHIDQRAPQITSKSPFTCSRGSHGATLPGRIRTQ